MMCSVSWSCTLPGSLWHHVPCAGIWCTSPTRTLTFTILICGALSLRWDPDVWSVHALTLVGVGQQHWAFRSEIKLDEKQLKGVGSAELEFEGLDTFATVFLVGLTAWTSYVLSDDTTNVIPQNGKQILETDNHFTTHTVSFVPSYLGRATPTTLYWTRSLTHFNRILIPDLRSRSRSKTSNPQTSC